MDGTHLLALAIILTTVVISATPSNQSSVGLSPQIKFYCVAEVSALKEPNVLCSHDQGHVSVSPKEIDNYNYFPDLLTFLFGSSFFTGNLNSPTHVRIFSSHQH